MNENAVDVLVVYKVVIFQRRRKLHLLIDKGAPQRAIDRQTAFLAEAEAAHDAVVELRNKAFDAMELLEAAGQGRHPHTFELRAALARVGVAK